MIALLTCYLGTIANQSTLKPVPARKGGHGGVHYQLTCCLDNSAIFLSFRGRIFLRRKERQVCKTLHYLSGFEHNNCLKKCPLPLLTSASELLQGMTIFSKLDLRNAYHLFRIREGKEWKMAFNTHLGQFEYLVMLFWLTNVLAVFQAIVNDILRDFINHFVFVYLDDILIFSRSVVEHERHVKLVLQRLLENRLFVEAEKGFLSSIIKQENLRPYPVKVQAVLEWSTPPNCKQLQRFLGFANVYHRFIHDFSKIVSPHLSKGPVSVGTGSP